MKHLICLSLLLSLALQACCQQPTTTSNTDSIAFSKAVWQTDTLDGFLLKRTTFTNNKLFCSNQILSLIEIPKESSCRLAFAYDTLLTATSITASRHKALAAVNGSFFDMKWGNPVCYLRINGEEVGINTPSLTDSVNRKYYQYATIVLNNGYPHLLVPDSNRQWEQSLPDSNIMTAGPMLIRHGKAIPQRTDRTFSTSRHNRTALGIRPDGTVLILVADARFKTKANGFSLVELIKVMQWLGCSEAINLDGGGSSTMYVQGGSDNGVVNYPSDDNKFTHQGERPVSNILMLLPR